MSPRERLAKHLREEAAAHIKAMPVGEDATGLMSNEAMRGEMRAYADLCLETASSLGAGPKP